jgi:hypothetical protein
MIVQAILNKAEPALYELALLLAANRKKETIYSFVF